MWQEDETTETGYRLLRNMETKPNLEELSDIYDEENGLAQESNVPAFLNSFADFVRDFGRL